MYRYVWHPRFFHDLFLAAYRLLRVDSRVQTIIYSTVYVMYYELYIILLYYLVYITTLCQPYATGSRWLKMAQAKTTQSQHKASLKPGTSQIYSWLSDS